MTSVAAAVWKLTDAEFLSLLPVGDSVTLINMELDNRFPNLGPVLWELRWSG